jgi:hypothetical protein
VKDFITGQLAATSARVADADRDNQQLPDALAAEAAQVEFPQATDRSPADVATPGPAVPSATSALLGSPIFRSQGLADQKLTLQPPSQPGRLPKLDGSADLLWRQCRSLPPYIPATSFAEAVVDLVVPDATREITMATVRQHVGALPDTMTALKPSLQALVKNAGNDIGVFRTSVERWYDNEMDHVSREYKRYITKIALVVGTVIVLLFNINTITIGRYLYTDPAVNAAVSSVAAKTTACPAGESQQACLAILRAQMSATTVAGLPIGWPTVIDCNVPIARCNWLDQRGIFSRHGGSAGQAVLFLIGFLLTIVALIPGTRFWFGLLSRIGKALGF